MITTTVLILEVSVFRLWWCLALCSDGYGNIVSLRMPPNEVNDKAWRVMFRGVQPVTMDLD